MKSGAKAPQPAGDKQAQPPAGVAGSGEGSATALAALIRKRKLQGKHHNLEEQNATPSPKVP